MSEQINAHDGLPIPESFAAQLEAQQPVLAPEEITQIAETAAQRAVDRAFGVVVTEDDGEPA